MPTYRALGITASLHTADLAKSCASVIDFRGGEAQREDAQRVIQALKDAVKLPEQPVEREVLQFIGDHEDVPLFVVRAGASAKHQIEHGATLLRGDSDASSSLTDESVLSARIRQPDSANEDRPTQHRASIDLPKPILGPRALVLNVEICSKSFLPSREGGSSRGFGKDLKFEVFVNGTRAAVYFLPRRGGVPEYIDWRLRFCGTRVHKQLEVPWVYDAQSRGVRQARDQWEAVSASLANEAKDRGYDRWSAPSPSAEALVALSQLALPYNVCESGSGLVDLIITAGDGKKYGPDGGYLTGPARMVDDEYSTRHGALPVVSVLAADALLPNPHLKDILQQKSLMPETPFKRRKTIDLSSELGLSDGVLETSANDHGSASSRTFQGRTLRKRLSDINDMKAGHHQLPTTNRGEDPMEDNENILPSHHDIDAPGDTDVPDTATAESSGANPAVAFPKASRLREATSLTNSPSHRAVDDPGRNETPTSIRISGRPGSRTARQTKDQGWEDVVRSLKVPELSRGSVIGFGGQMGQRQISMARNGEFKEESVVVAMRFVVV
ncbi:hypothetical protein EJ03DRAFT_207479 [Teratosphaeria nubilosa]|uniref:Uncharacterized protein n=1 Tax=Teratosphaeria nubilosa TaxID=161662 RepID=A0A6G1KZN9_9PEZI|nr:hypothetical protein EJ03DRAFT_207479 [Teratosphaeria nubilosa]